MRRLSIKFGAELIEGKMKRRSVLKDVLNYGDSYIINKSCNRNGEYQATRIIAEILGKLEKQQKRKKMLDKMNVEKKMEQQDGCIA